MSDAQKAAGQRSMLCAASVCHAERMISLYAVPLGRKASDFCESGLRLSL